MLLCFCATHVAFFVLLWLSGIHGLSMVFLPNRGPVLSPKIWCSDCSSVFGLAPGGDQFWHQKPVDQKQMQPEAMQGAGMLQYGSMLKDQKTYPQGTRKPMSFVAFWSSAPCTISEPSPTPLDTISAYLEKPCLDLLEMPFGATLIHNCRLVLVQGILLSLFCLLFVNEALKTNQLDDLVSFGWQLGSSRTFFGE